MSGRPPPTAAPSSHFAHHSRRRRPVRVFAGLWSIWYGPDDTKLRTCTILTTAANSAISGLHDRMPVILASGPSRPGWTPRPRPPAIERDPWPDYQPGARPWRRSGSRGQRRTLRRPRVPGAAGPGPADCPVLEARPVRGAMLTAAIAAPAVLRPRTGSTWGVSGWDTEVENSATARDALVGAVRARRQQRRAVAWIGHVEPGLEPVGGHRAAGRGTLRLGRNRARRAAPAWRRPPRPRR